MNKRIILLNWPEMPSLLDGQKSFSTPHSAEQRIRDLLPVAGDIQALRAVLSPTYDWTSLATSLEEIRHHYCDVFMDGKAGERAAREICDAMENKNSHRENVLLHSLREKLFASGH